MFLSIATLVATFLICYALIYLINLCTRGGRLHKMASKFPGPVALPLIGNAHSLVGGGEHILNVESECSRLYSSPYRLWIGSSLLFIIHDPDQAKEICLNPASMEKGKPFTQLVGTLMGNGLLSAPVSLWRPHRRLIEPSFNKRILDTFVETFSTQSKIFTEIIEKNLDGAEFEIFELISACMLDMLCVFEVIRKRSLGSPPDHPVYVCPADLETTLSVKIDCQRNRSSEYVEKIQQIIWSASERYFHIWLHPDFIYYRTKMGKDHRRNVNYLHDFADAIIRNKKKELLVRNVNGQAAVVDDDGKDAASGSLARRQPTLHHLMTLDPEAGKLTDKELREEISTLIVAGNDTSARVLATTMLLLASYPEFQDKAYRELHEIYGDADIGERPVTPGDLPQMKYLERFVKETMRLFPASPYVMREMMKDINIGEHTLPKGSYAVIGIRTIQRKEEYWPNPLKFDPDRFLPEENAKRNPYTYMPFSSGPRNCVGQVQGMMSSKTLLATVLRRYVLKKDNPPSVEDIRFGMEILMNPVEPITLRIERRNRI